jgi:Flp pilus assembly protein TadD
MSRYRRDILMGLVLAGLTLVAFWPALRNPFTEFDDGLYVTDNPHVRAGLTAKEFCWAFVATRASNWHPLTWLSLQLDADLFGTEPWGFHFTNVVLHMVTTLLLFAFLRWTTAALWPSALVAALFAVHPLHVESVAWVAERKDVLSGLFWMLTLLAYAWFVERRDVKRYVLVLLVFALGLMAKPMLVTLPCVLLLLDYWPLKRTESWRRLVVEKAPLFALGLVASVVTVYAQHQGGSVGSLEHYGPAERSANAVLSYGRYLEKTFWPQNLALFYPYSDTSSMMIPVLLSGLILLGVTGFCLYTRRSRPYLLVGWLWYLGMLVPVIGLVQVGGQAMADRYTYLPLIGVFVMVVWGAAGWVEGQRKAGIAGTLAAGVVVLICIVGTRVQLGYWQDNVTLWQHTVDVTGPSWVAQSNLGYSLEKAGKNDDALIHYQEAIRLNPQFALGHCNVGAALMRRGQPNEGWSHFQTALRLDPACLRAHINVGNFLEKRGKLEEAVHHFQIALSLDAEDVVTYNRLGVLMEKQRKPEEALRYYRQANQIDPGSATTHYNLGTLLGKQGNFQEAIFHLRQAVALSPNYARAHFNLGIALETTGKSQEALTHFRRAVELAPQARQFRLALGLLLQKLGRSEEAAAVNR